MKNSNALLLPGSGAPLLPGTQGIVVAALSLLAVGSGDLWAMWVVSRVRVIFRQEI